MSKRVASEERGVGAGRAPRPGRIGFVERLLHGLSWRLPIWLFHYDHSYLVGATELLLPVREYSNYEIRAAGVEDAETMHAAGVDRSVFLRRIGRGDHCVVVLKDGQAVAWSWSATGRLFVKYGGAIVETGEDEFFLYNVYTLPSERLKGFILSCFRKQLEYRHGQCRHGVLGTISVFNGNSLNTHCRMGFRVCGETYGLTVAGISLCIYKSWPRPAPRVRIFVRRPPRNHECV